jgi:hypothetical protein
MHAQLPTLTFLPIESLLIHERHDDQRTRPLVLRIRASGVMRNPPIVCPLNDGTGRYMVLDGANRVTALHLMGSPHVLVQVVQPDDPGLVLQTWNHVVWELNPSRFLAGLRTIPETRLVPVKDEARELVLESECGLALVKTCKGSTYAVCSQADALIHRIQHLHALVDSYINRARLDRTNLRDVQILGEIYPQLCGLVIFPRFKLETLMRLVGEGYVLPAGVTRFMISPRALHINYDLQEITTPKPIEEKNAALHHWLQDRVAHKAVRFYAEATFLFDE